MLDKLIKAENKKAYMRRYNERNKDKKKEYNKEYWDQNKDKIKEQQEEYRENNIKKRREHGKEYYKSNKDKIKEYQQKYRENNVEKIKEYRENNIDKIKEYSNSSTSYKTYAHQISYAEEVRQDPENEELLQVKCTYCKEWFNPSMASIQSRIKALEGRTEGECRLYCSDECKKLCPVYGQIKYPKDQKPYLPPRDTQAQWADMVKGRDEYKCIKCGSTEDLTAHHREGILWEPIESADIDIGVTLCKKCEGEVHKQEGCSYYDMRCPT